MFDDKAHDIDPDLAAELAAATDAAERAALTPAEEQRARMLAQIEEAKTQRRIAERKRRQIKGESLLRDARKEAKDAYATDFFDLAALFPDVDPSKLPGDGILVLRSHPPEAKKTFNRAVNAAGAPSDPTDALTDLVCASIVYPSFAKPEDGVRFRAFLESPLGCGAANQIGAVVLELGGARLAEAKRPSR